MNRIKIASLALMFLFCAAGPITAQEQNVSSEIGKRADQIDNVVQERVERAIEEKEPEWKLAEQSGPIDGAVNYMWKLGEQEVRVSITYLASQEDAAKYLKLVTSTLPIGPGSKMEGLGDEAYSWNYRGSVAIRFRKGSMVIILNADPFGIKKSGNLPGEELIKLTDTAEKVAMRFAQHIAEQIETPKGTGRQ